MERFFISSASTAPTSAEQSQPQPPAPTSAEQPGEEVSNATSSAEQPASTGLHPGNSAEQPRFQVINSLTGERIEVPTSVDTRIHTVTTLERILPYVAESLRWPVSHVSLSAGGTTVKYIHRIKHRTVTRITELEMFQTSESQTFVIQATALQRPRTFTNEDEIIYCLCDFGGCCRRCRVPGARSCRGCGNNTCCRSQNCGHQCCEEGSVVNGEEHCPFSGCQPAWMQYRQIGQTKDERRKKRKVQTKRMQSLRKVETKDERRKTKSITQTKADGGGNDAANESPSGTSTEVPPDQGLVHGFESVSSSRSSQVRCSCTDGGTQCTQMTLEQAGLCIRCRPWWGQGCRCCCTRCDPHTSDSSPS